MLIFCEWNEDRAGLGIIKSCQVNLMLERLGLKLVTREVLKFYYGLLADVSEK